MAMGAGYQFGVVRVSRLEFNQSFGGDRKEGAEERCRLVAKTNGALTIGSLKAVVGGAAS
jgi:hypothetical protein